MELGFYLKEKVPKYNPGQHPQYGTIRDIELDKGDFVFVLDRKKFEDQMKDRISYDLVTARKYGTREAYYVFIHKYEQEPLASDYLKQAKNLVRGLERGQLEQEELLKRTAIDKDWQRIASSTTTKTFEDFISQHGNDPLAKSEVGQAHKKIRELQELQAREMMTPLIKEEWQNAVSSNTKQEYLNYISKYEKQKQFSQQVKDARVRISVIEKLEKEQAKQQAKEEEARQITPEFKCSFKQDKTLTIKIKISKTKSVEFSQLLLFYTFSSKQEFTQISCRRKSPVKFETNVDYPATPTKMYYYLQAKDSLDRFHYYGDIQAPGNTVSSPSRFYRQSQV